MDTMEARDVESEMLARCAAAARAALPAARDQREANVFRVAAMIVVSRFPGEADQLMQLAERYFAQHPDHRLDSGEVVRKGWIVSFPRLKDMLCRRLREG